MISLLIGLNIKVEGKGLACFTQILSKLSFSQSFCFLSYAHTGEIFCAVTVNWEIVMVSVLQKKQYWILGFYQHRKETSSTWESRWCLSCVTLVTSWGLVMLQVKVNTRCFPWAMLNTGVVPSNTLLLTETLTMQSSFSNQVFISSCYWNTLKMYGGFSLKIFPKFHFTFSSCVSIQRDSWSSGKDMGKSGRTTYNDLDMLHKPLVSNMDYMFSIWTVQQMSVNSVHHEHRSTESTLFPLGPEKLNKWSSHLVLF